MRTQPHGTTTLERYLGLVSSRVGVIRSVTRVSRGAEEPSPPILYQAQLAHFDFKNARPLERAAMGKGATDAEALAGALGGAVGRHSPPPPPSLSFCPAGLAPRRAPVVSPAGGGLFAPSPVA